MTTDGQGFIDAKSELRPCTGRQATLRAYLVQNGADKQPHSGRFLIDHLLGVQGILRRSKAEEVVCLAGLFHSVYGTAIYKPTLISRDKRVEVQALIGHRAEEIVWTFGLMPARPHAWEVGLSNKDHSFLEKNFPVEHSTPDQLWLDLLRLECANLLEQKSALHKFPFLALKAQDVGMLDADGFCV